VSGEAVHAYAADASLKGKLRRRYVRLFQRKRAHVRLDRPMLSISFDDVPMSSAREGADIVEAAGARATFFISVGLCGRDGPMGLNATEAEVAALAVRGHEIGCHSFSHLDCGQARAREIDHDVEANRARLARCVVREPATFAYPYGDVSIDAKRVVGRRFRAARALHAGMIDGACDLNQLPAVGIEGPDGATTAAKWLDRAVARKAWLILYTHDVRNDPSDWGCTPAALELLLARAKQLGFEIRPVSEALDRIAA
jgi:peptidoglycan/xylan/chitin deacetylase (PgdA/CDA1 family)